MASMLLTKPLKCLLFRSPLLKGEGVKQALAWNREQLVDLQRLWELRRQHRIDTGLIPMAQPPPMMLCFAKRGPTSMMIMWMQPLMTQLWSSDTRYSNTRSPLYVRRRNSTSTSIDK
jgi:hypothetical protein